MSKLRLVFILSLIILAGLFVFTLYSIPLGRNRPEPSRTIQIINAGSEWILQYDIVNNQQRDIKYTIYLTVDGSVTTDSVVVKSGKRYTYIHQISPEQLTEGKVTLALYEEGKAEPVEQATHYIGSTKG